MQKYGESDVKADADYIAGQIKFEQGLYQESVDLLCDSPNANYFYARYTMGIAYSRMGSGMKRKVASVIFDQPASKPV